MKRNEKGVAPILLLLAVVILIVGFFFLLVKNALNYSTFEEFGFDQYVANITHLQKDVNFSALLIARDLYAEPDILSQGKRDKIILKLKKNRKFKLRGYLKDEHVGWLAAELYNKGEKVTGYFVYPGDVEQLSNEISSTGFNTLKNYTDFEVDEKIVSRYKGIFIKYIINRYGVKSESNNIKKQIIHEDGKFHTLDFLGSDPLYYTEKSADAVRIKKIYDIASQDDYKRLVTENTFTDFEALDYIRDNLI